MSAGSLAKTYSGKLVKGRKQVTVRSELATSPLRCRDFFTPSFAWGYHGGAPDNLAIAILEDHFGLTRAAVDARVIRLYSAFADEMVSNFGRDEAWSLSGKRVAKWVSEREQAFPCPTEPEVRPAEPLPQATVESIEVPDWDPQLAAVDF
jgi:hypothetical protein